MHVVCVTFTIEPHQVDHFMPLMLTQALTSLEMEEGCLVFDVCRSETSKNSVFLYEVYEDEAAFQDHLKSAHFSRFDAATAAMIAQKAVSIYQKQPL